MKTRKEILHRKSDKCSKFQAFIMILLCCVMIFPQDLIAATVIAQADSSAKEEERSVAEIGEISLNTETVADTIVMQMDSVDIEPTDTILSVVMADDFPSEFDGRRAFNTNPTRAVWLSALVPGLGQIYNRRYWKLPIIIGGFMGLGYATSWNNRQYQDYTLAYRDITDSDPGTKSYMNFFPPNTEESSLDKTWVSNTMKSRKDFYRRNRDLCIICVVGLYLLCMVDAYVDASLAHFDISPDLSLDVQPAMFIAPVDNRVALGLNWAFNF